MRYLRAICVLLSAFCYFSATAQVAKYQPITAKRTGPVNALSPDPLVNYTWPDPKATDDLQTYQLKPKSFKADNNGSLNTSALTSKNSITVTGNGSIRFDFGQTNAAWLEFDSADLADSITMSISEYNEPAIVNEGAVNRFKTKAPVRYGNTYRLELNPELYEGARFGWLHVIKHNSTWHLNNPRLVCQVKPVNYRGSFVCSDPQLTRIWYTGAYTVKTNLLKNYFGAILMERSDRQSWTGDAYPSQAASMVAFGNYDFVRANLINTSGLNNGIASYSLYWVLSLIDYVNYSGDVEFGKKYIDNAVAKLDLAYQHFDNLPNLGFYGWDERLGAGFENPNIAEPRHAYAMLSIRSWLEFARLMQQTGRQDLADKYNAYATAKIAAERNKNTWTTEFGLHASADAINTGMTMPAENAAFYRRNYTSRVNRLSYSPFNEFFVIGALAKMQKYDDALSSIKDMWGGQLNYGGTTFFEVYRPSWNNILHTNDAPVNNQCGYTSLTHPWSAGVTKWLSEEVLGIKPLSPGFEQFEIVPHLGAGLTSVKGTTPTLKGAITVDIDLHSGINKISIPKGTLAKRVAIPLAGNIGNVTLNGKPIKLADLQVSDGYLNLHDLPAGDYTYRISYRSINPKPTVKKLAWDYAINKFMQDSLTGGQWIRKYGNDGYMLFNYDNKGKHLQKTPAYISSILLRNQANIRMETIAQAKNTLTDTAGNAHNFGAIITQDPKACLQTMTIDLQVTDYKPHQVALYFLDPDGNERRSAIELFDLKNMNLLAPVQVVRNYQNGKYLVFTYSGSIRIRLDQVRGENVALSGIFFDQPK